MASLLRQAGRRFGLSVFRSHITKTPCSNFKLSSVTLPDRHNPHNNTGGSSKMLACTLCHNRKVRCEADAESNSCVTCKAAGVECIPRSRKRRRAGTAPTNRPVNDDGSQNYGNENRRSVSQASGVGIEMPVEQAAYQTPSTPFPATTYIGRGHYVADDDEIDETSARAFEPAKIKVGPHASTQKETLVLWKAFDIPPQAARQSLLSAFLDYCNLWTPVLEAKDIQDLSCFDQEKSSMLLAQSLWLAGSRVTNAPSVIAFASSDDFYHRAKAVFWSGVETDGLSAIKASLMLQWYNPQAPEHISFDNSGFWLKIGVGIAHQIGLHKESPPGPSRAIRRRLWWSLVLWVAPSNQPPHSYFANMLSRMQHSAGSVSVVATLAASFVARIFEDFLARDEIKVLAPISTRYCLISSMALVSVMPDKRLWDAVQPDLEILQLALTELSKRWRSAIGASRALQNAIKKRQQRISSSTAGLRMDDKNSLEYFKMIDLGYCRIWSTLSQQLSSSPLDIQGQIPEPTPPPNGALETNYEQFLDPGEPFDMGTIQFEHVENWILNDGFLFDP
ncbi:acetamidase regulatory protein [Fusarium sporotrichioides]|uniref:Acetamidase regulatory protein n=1 Tax=Fusarium sporotrichioides TaxID=5514 RepID=A0A395RKY2_FUSSP|nr:acetamidase regulatory protein [Fusarium sporotrichioides]